VFCTVPTMKLSACVAGVLLVSLAACAAPQGSSPEGSNKVYEVGDIGPGGGIVFFVSEQNINCATPGCRYLEVSPPEAEVHRMWVNLDGIPVSVEVDGAVGAGLGTGQQNSLDISRHEGATAENSAAVYALNYTHGGKSDWFLPSKYEMNELCKFAHFQPTGDPSVLCKMTANIRDGFHADMYWSSSEDIGIGATYPYLNNAWSVDMNAGIPKSQTKNYEYRVRPIRAF
jgi:hypothetical protein